MATATLQRDVAAPAQTVFDTLVYLEGLPSWNDAITRVLEVPARLEVGSEWVVEMSAMGQRWASRSHALELDPVRRVFAYRSCTDDGNPSFAEWRWRVEDSGSGCRVTVSWVVNPKTFWRRVLLAHFRRRQLARAEVPRSLEALAETCERRAARA
jgi:uncharacterized protein YndB with AHSA1/START domain